MSKQGMRSRMAAIMGKVGASLGIGKVHTYPDPILSMPHSKPARIRRGRENDSRPMIRRGNLGPPPCEPGSISYHDMLVRKLGRFRADGFRNHFVACKQNSRLTLVLPTAEELDVYDWEWRV